MYSSLPSLLESLVQDYGILLDSDLLLSVDSAVVISLEFADATINSETRISNVTENWRINT